MREAIGGSWIFTIVIVFIVIFSSYLAISVNYSKAFKVKSGVVDIIERSEGYNTTAMGKIETYLNGNGYFVYGSCPKNSGGIPLLTPQKGSKKWYCVEKVDNSTSGKSSAYYKVTVFFKLDLPVLGEIFTFPISGDTKPIYNPQE